LSGRLYELSRNIYWPSGSPSAYAKTRARVVDDCTKPIEFRNWPLSVTDPPVPSVRAFLECLKKTDHLRISIGLFDIRNHNGHMGRLQRFDFEELILLHKDHEISIHVQQNEHLKCLVLEE